MPKKITQTFTRETTPSTPSIQLTQSETTPLLQLTQSETTKKIVQNTRREIRKISPAYFSTTLLQQLQRFTMSPKSNYYLGFGGVGDALLLLSSCWDDPNAKVIFFANYQPFVKAFFDLFQIPTFLHDNIMGSFMANRVYDFVKKLPNFTQSAHLADNLDYDDWKNEDKYTNRINKFVPWIKHFDKKQFDKPVVIIAPSASYKDHKRQRHLKVEEYQRLINLYLNDYEVFATGSISDLHHFGMIPRPNFHWLNSDNIYHGNGNEENINLRDMLKIINSAELVISMDTWLKTYSLLCGIPTTVIRTRWDGNYRPAGTDVADWIFLNPNFWPFMKLEKIETLLGL
jgi:hypothetical protein